MKRILWILLVIGMLALPVAAHSVPDLNRAGSIGVTMCYNGKAVTGGELTLYRVGEIKEENGDYSFSLTEDFAASKVPLDNIQLPESAEKLADFARRQKLPGQSKKIDSEGKAEFRNLKPGLFLLMQLKAAQGYQCAKPFLVSVPILESGSYSYHVDASPKVSPVPQPDETESPKTGQSAWPIWSFGFSAAALIGLTQWKKSTKDV